MREDDIKERLEKMHLKDADGERMEQHKKAFKASLINAVKSANEKEKRFARKRLTLAYALISVLLIISTMFVHNYIKVQAFRKIVMNNPAEKSVYSFMRLNRHTASRIGKIARIKENKTIGVAYIYVEVPESVVIVNLKNKTVVGVGFPLTPYNKYDSKEVLLTNAEKKVAIDAVKRNKFVEALNKKSITVRSSAVVYTGRGTNAPCKIAEVNITLKSGRVITAFVNASRATLLDVTGMQNIAGEYVSTDCTIHYFLYIPDENEN